MACACSVLRNHVGRLHSNRIPADRMGRLLVRGVHSTVAAINPGQWPQAFVAELRSQIETENQQRPDQAIGCRYNRHFYIIYRGGRYARIFWRDDTTYELSTAKSNLQWQIIDLWRLATDEQRIISGSSSGTPNRCNSLGEARQRAVSRLDSDRLIIDTGAYEPAYSHRDCCGL
jgi:hypothetical protein